MNGPTKEDIEDAKWHRRIDLAVAQAIGKYNEAGRFEALARSAIMSTVRGPAPSLVSAVCLALEAVRTETITAERERCASWIEKRIEEEQKHGGLEAHKWPNALRENK